MGYYEDSAFHIEYVPLYKNNKPPIIEHNNVHSDQIENNETEGKLKNQWLLICILYLLSTT